MDIMPTVDGLRTIFSPPPSGATTQPDNQDGLGPTNQEDGGCNPKHNQSCNHAPSGAVANPSATTVATTETLRELPKTEQRLQGCTVASDRDPVTPKLKPIRKRVRPAPVSSDEGVKAETLPWRKER